jgi:hypothetical protein
MFPPSTMCPPGFSDLANALMFMLDGGKLRFFGIFEATLFVDIKDRKCISTVKLQVSMCVYNIEINFFQKVTVNEHQISPS